MHLKDLRKGVVGNMSEEPENDVAFGTGQLDINNSEDRKKNQASNIITEDEFIVI
jgi:hypothetical protein